MTAPKNSFAQKEPVARKFGANSPQSKPQYTTNKKEGGKGKGVDNSDRCFRCEGRGHKAYQCPTRNNLHIGVTEEEPKENEVAENEDGEETPQFNADDLADSTRKTL